MINHELDVGRIPAAQVAALLRVTQLLESTLDLPEVLQTAIDSAVDVTGLDTGAIYLADGDDLVIGATTPPLPDDFPEELRRARSADHPHLEESMRERRVIFVEDLQKAHLTAAERNAAESRGLRSLLYVPLFSRNEILGIFLVGSVERVADLTPDHVDVCAALSSTISLAVANARLFQSGRDTNRKLTVAYADAVHHEERLRALATAMTLAEERQRRDLAVELHDRVSEPLAVLKMRLQTFKQSLPADVSAEEITLITKLLNEAIEQTRAITLETSPPFVFELGLVPAVEWLCQKSEESGLRSEVFADDCFDDLDEDVRLFAFQAVRELLDNVVRHARAASVTVALECADSSAAIRVTDNGCGFEQIDLVDIEPEDRGFGLFGLRERVAYLGGTMQVQSALGAGTTVTLTLPLHSPALS